MTKNVANRIITNNRKLLKNHYKLKKATILHVQMPTPLNNFQVVPNKTFETLQAPYPIVKTIQSQQQKDKLFKITFTSSSKSCFYFCLFEQINISQVFIKKEYF
eukprot:TRINITY_DN96645_c0_g1_i1.p4 TRINITY_DN96645_c0_g1~~TRINITY_DN96645_c0_g1_i1.p4  ORF type:complete len:104 (-),score=2.75 TRINITY_DN96645_c0_g1_i1:505-816(-)